MVLGWCWDGVDADADADADDDDDDDDGGGGGGDDGAGDGDGDGDGDGGGGGGDDDDDDDPAVKNSCLNLISLQCWVWSSMVNIEHRSKNCSRILGTIFSTYSFPTVLSIVSGRSACSRPPIPLPSPKKSTNPKPRDHFGKCIGNDGRS